MKYVNWFWVAWLSFGAGCGMADLRNMNRGGIPPASPIANVLVVLMTAMFGFINVGIHCDLDADGEVLEIRFFGRKIL